MRGLPARVRRHSQSPPPREAVRFRLQEKKDGLNKITAYAKFFYMISLVFFSCFPFHLTTTLSTPDIEAADFTIQKTGGFHQRSHSFFPRPAHIRRQTEDLRSVQQIDKRIFTFLMLLSIRFFVAVSDSLSFQIASHPKPPPDVAPGRTRINTTQNRSENTFYFSGEVIYYCFE